MIASKVAAEFLCRGVHCQVDGKQLCRGQIRRLPPFCGRHRQVPRRQWIGALSHCAAVYFDGKLDLHLVLDVNRFELTAVVSNPITAFKDLDGCPSQACLGQRVRQELEGVVHLAPNLEGISLAAKGRGLQGKCSPPRVCRRQRRLQMCLLHRYVGGGSRTNFSFIMDADFGVAGAPVNLPHFKYSASVQNTRQRRTSRGTLNELFRSCIFTTWAICNVLLYLVPCDSARRRRTFGPHT